MKAEQHALEESFYRECARLLDAVHASAPGSGGRPTAGTAGIPATTASRDSERSRKPVVLNKVCRSVEEAYDVVRRLKVRAAGP